MTAIAFEGVKLIAPRLLGLFESPVSDFWNRDEISSALRDRLKRLLPVIRQLDSLRDNPEHPAAEWIKDLHQELQEAERLLGPVEEFFQLLQISGKIKKVNEKLSKLLEEAPAVQLASLTSTSLAEERRRRWEYDTSAPDISFGGERLVNRVIEALLDGKRRWIALTGMGGIGKTHTARTVFNDNRVRNHFTGGIYWITVSKDQPRTHVLLGELFEKLVGRGRIDDFPDDLNTAKGKVKSELKNHQKVFLVFDDVWQAETVQCLEYIWEEEHGAILVTTRNQGNLRCITRRHDYEHIQAPTLPEDKSWELFCRHAFRGDAVPPELGDGVPSDLEDVARQEANECKPGVAKQVAHECKGLPLALRIIGETMRGKTLLPHELERGKTLRGEWERVLEELRSANVYEDAYEELYCKLQLSVDSLRTEDPRLVDCFCYFAAFPEDHEVDGKYLMEWWIAEGMLGNRDVSFGAQRVDAGNLLDSLVEKSIIEWRYHDFGEDRYVIHDVMRDLAHRNLKWDFAAKRKIPTNARKCLYAPARRSSEIPLGWTARVTAGVNLWQALKECFIPDTSGLLLAERLSLYKARTANLPNRINVPHLRVLMLTENYSLRTLPLGFFRPLSNLIVLDLSRTGIEEIADAVLQGLKKLKFLNLTQCRRLLKISNAIERLLNLETVLLEGCLDLENLPRVGSLINLTTFSATLRPEYNIACDHSDGCQWWRDYITFRGVSRYVILELFQLPNLRRLELDMQGHSQDGIPCPDMSSLASLEELKVFTFGWLPTGITSLRNLKVLRLWTDRAVPGLPALDLLPCLEYLELWGYTTFPESFGRSGAFLSLKTLRLLRCIKWTFSTFYDGCMPKIKSLHLRGWSSMNGLPQSLTKLRTLKTLEMHDFYCEGGTIESVFGQPDCFPNLEILRVGLEVKALGRTSLLEELDLGSLQNLKRFYCNVPRDHLPLSIREMEAQGKFQIGFA